MRKNLEKLKNEIITVTGFFKRYGVKNGNGAKWNTAVLTDITYDDEEISDHLWFTLMKEWLKTELVPGTKLSVTGKVRIYKRRDGSFDYGLIETRDLIILEYGNGNLKPAKKWYSNSYLYFKFLTNDGPKWYRKKKDKIERVFFKYNGNGFDEKIIPSNEYDDIYIKLIKEC